MQKADYLLRLMKQRTDEIIANDDKLQQFLMWVNEKSLTVDLPYKPLAIRAFYLTLVFARGIGLSYDPDRNRDIAFIFDLDVYLSRDFDIALDFNLSRILDRSCNFDIVFGLHNYRMISEVYEELYSFFKNVFLLGLPLELRQALEATPKTTPKATTSAGLQHILSKAVAGLIKAGLNN